MKEYQVKVTEKFGLSADCVSALESPVVANE